MSRFALLVLALLAGSCRSPNGEGTGTLREKASPEAVRAEETPLGPALQQFGIDLFHDLAPEPGNFFFSPLSITAAFSMAHAGAEGTTREELAACFGFAAGPREHHTRYQELANHLTAAGSGIELRVANRLWGDEEQRFLPAFLETLEIRYGASLGRVPMARDPEGSRAAINAWIAEQTEGLIPELLGPGSVHRLTRLVLANAVLFRGEWADRFDPETTREAPFHVSPERTVSIPMMSRTGIYATAERDGVSVLELPYAGDRFSLVVFLPPPESTLREIEQALDGPTLTGWLTDLPETRVRVSLPRFGITHSFPLTSALARLGLEKAFLAGEADFSGMDGTRELFLAAAVHQAVLTVDEKGTEAAAATGVVFGTTSLPPVFSADRPFLFCIRDRESGTILFWGRLADPSA